MGVFLRDYFIVKLRKIHDRTDGKIIYFFRNRVSLQNLRSYVIRCSCEQLFRLQHFEVGQIIGETKVNELYRSYFIITLCIFNLDNAKSTITFSGLMSL